MKTENLKITELKPYERNAKQHHRRQIDQIKESIRRFGMNDDPKYADVIIDRWERLTGGKAEKI